MSITERLIQEWFYRWFGNRYECLCPNYTPVGWFECDIFALTKSGYFHEFEIKLTVADFKADAEKRDRGYRFVGNRYTNECGDTKYKRLSSADESGPVNFWYIVPEGLITPDDLPEFAGLKYAIALKDKTLLVEDIVKAPRLHRQKAKQEVADHVKTVFYYRFWRERIRRESA